MIFSSVKPMTNKIPTFVSNGINSKNLQEISKSVYYNIRVKISVAR